MQRVESCGELRCQLNSQGEYVWTQIVFSVGDMGKLHPFFAVPLLPYNFLHFVVYVPLVCRI